MKKTLLFATLLLAACTAPSPPPAALADTQKISTVNCDDPDAPIACCFENQPAAISSVMRIAGKDEAGEQLSISGTVLKSDGKTPFANVLLYAYHTDSKGIYSKAGNEKGIQKWHGRLHGWCRSDANGRYEIRSIRPAPYPSGQGGPAHIHMAVREPDGATYYINDFVFADDPNVNETYFRLIGPGDKGVVQLKKDAQGVWKGTRDIPLVEALRNR